MDGIVDFTYEGVGDFYYKKNIQGDIIGIIDINGQEIAKYDYDAWGNHKILVLNNGTFVDISENANYTASGSNNKIIAELNPIRYRGYYYDSETGLYYLNSRYYDPETGRFINADDVSYLSPNEFNGLNLYAYCVNNPVMLSDENGTAWWNPFSWDWAIIGAGVLTVLGAVAAIGISIATFGAGTPLAMTIVAGITLAAGVLTGVNGLSTIGEGISNGYNFMRDGLFNEILGLSDNAYSVYSNVVSSISAIGTAVLGIYSFTGRAQAARAGREFLGKGYSKTGSGRWVSKDGFRQMRLDISGHMYKGVPSPHHFNLETWRYKIGSIKGNKLSGNIHKFFKWFITWIE